LPLRLDPPRSNVCVPATEKRLVPSTTIASSIVPCAQSYSIFAPLDVTSSRMRSPPQVPEGTRGASVPASEPHAAAGSTSATRATSRAAVTSRAARSISAFYARRRHELRGWRPAYRRRSRRDHGCVVE